MQRTVVKQYLTDCAAIAVAEFLSTYYDSAQAAHEAKLGLDAVLYFVDRVLQVPSQTT